MRPFQVVYAPIGVPTFHLESARAEFARSVELLRSLEEGVICPEDLLLSVEALSAYLDDKDPDLIILQNATFANGAYAGEILRRFRCPVLLWTLREPVIDGGRLRLNSLTGAFSAGNLLRSFRPEPFPYVLGAPEEDAVRQSVGACIRAARLKKDLAGLRMAAIGHTPQGFGFGRGLDGELLRTFGVTLESIEARELIDRARSYTDAECAPYLERSDRCMRGLEHTEPQNRLDYARLYRAYETYVTEGGIGAVASRCWPDFFTAYGTPVCAVLAMLNDMGVAAACEADTYGALSMYMGMKLTGRPTFFGDPVSLDEGEGTVTFWHCGTAACSLARTDTGAEVGVHCNRRIGPTLDFGCAPERRVTVFRVGKASEGSFRFYLATGEALDRPRQFTGTSVVVRTDSPAGELIRASVRAGWEPHFAVVYGDAAEALTMLGEMLGLEVCRY